MEQQNTLKQTVGFGNLGATEKAEFIRQTYIHVALAVLAFIGFEFIYAKTGFMENFAMWIFSSGQWTWLMVMGGFMLLSSIFVKWTTSSINKGMAYIGLFGYAALKAIIFIPLLYLAIAYTNDSMILHKAALVTGGLFAGLTAIVLTTKKDFSFLRSALMIGGGAAIFLIIAGAIFGFNLGLWFSVAMVILMGGNILYQTSQLLHEYSNDQYVAASIGLFASLMTMFYYILMIFMRMQGDD